MKVVLVNPPRVHPMPSNVPAWVDLESGAYPPLGLLCVAAAAIDETDCHVVVLDCPTVGISHTQLEGIIREERPDVVGIQAMTFTLVDVRLAAEGVRRAAPAAHLCIGGPHAHLYPEETLRLSIADSVVLGEGEVAFVELLRQLAGGEWPRPAAGLAFLGGDGLVATPPALIDDLDALPMPNRTLLPIRPYRSVLARRTPITTMMSSRGCPYQCAFCDRPHLGKRFRARSALAVVEEMQTCVELGIREIVFYDDTFTIDRGRVEEICELIRERDLAVTWDIRARINTVDAALLRMLRAAGCVRIHYGVEAGTQEIVDILDKGLDLGQVPEVFRWTRDAGITTLAYFMIGNPTETREQIERTFAFAEKLRPDYVHLSVTTPFPGTPLYEMARERGVIAGDPWQAFAADPTASFTPPLWTETLSREELIDLLARGYRRLYLRPGAVLRKLARVRSPGELWRKAKAGLRLVLSGGGR